ncbi:MAG: hypothetical protein ACTTJM_04045 [Bergeyella cardium]
MKKLMCLALLGFGLSFGFAQEQEKGTQETEKKECCKADAKKDKDCCKADNEGKKADCCKKDAKGKTAACCKTKNKKEKKACCSTKK